MGESWHFGRSNLTIKMSIHILRYWPEIAEMNIFFPFILAYNAIDKIPPFKTESFLIGKSPVTGTNFHINFIPHFWKEKFQVFYHSILVYAGFSCKLWFSATWLFSSLLVDWLALFIEVRIIGIS